MKNHHIEELVPFYVLLRIELNPVGRSTQIHFSSIWSNGVDVSKSKRYLKV